MPIPRKSSIPVQKETVNYPESEEQSETISIKKPKSKPIVIPYESIAQLVTKFLHQKLHKKNGILRWADPNCQEPDYLLGQKVLNWLIQMKEKGEY